MTDRYVIGRDGVFATLWDRQDRRLVIENSTEEHCRRALDSLTAVSVEPPQQSSEAT
ncbi:hypothetical protein [Streptomyces viridochromogenes]|uniref:hypothetical protein n=1 Tax=Streptomyces viridochromogenes TaxID=1938 RepID=UPI000A8BAB40|nr:hypothetical protein [Streptomyces viridochromogenes]